MYQLNAWLLAGQEMFSYVKKSCLAMSSHGVVQKREPLSGSAKAAILIWITLLALTVARVPRPLPQVTSLAIFR